MKDLEEPHYNQIFYVPEVEFNAYDGIALGLKLSNRSILNKPFTFSATPMYSSNTGKFVGKATFLVEDNIRDEAKLYRIRQLLIYERRRCYMATVAVKDISAFDATKEVEIRRMKR